MGIDRGKRRGNRDSCEAVNDLIQQEEVCGYGDLRTTAGVPYSLVFLSRLFLLECLVRRSKTTTSDGGKYLEPIDVNMSRFGPDLTKILLLASSVVAFV